MYRANLDGPSDEIYSSASYAGRDSIYNSVLTVTGGSNKWCSPWLTSADGGATEESLRRQRTVNPRNCGSPCASRDPGPEYWKLHLTLPLHPPPPILRGSAPLRATCEHRRDAFIIGHNRFSMHRDTIWYAHFLGTDVAPLCLLPERFQRYVYNRKYTFIRGVA